MGGQSKFFKSDYKIVSHTEKFNKVDLIIFTGVAGSAKKVINQWDVVILVIQHDMDARPFSIDMKFQLKKHLMSSKSVD